MDDEGFRNWLLNSYNEKTTSSRLSNCHRVEVYEGDLDQHYFNDGLSSLIRKLNYTSDDQCMGKKPNHNVPINGNQYTGSATLKQAVHLYLNYKSNHKTLIPTQQKSNPAKMFVGKMKTTIKATEWPKWDNPDENELFEVIKLIAKYIKFLDPRIIEKIVKDNTIHKEEWVEKLSRKNVNPEIYLWDSSPCTFPGVRRYAGSKEIAYFRNHTTLTSEDIPNAIKLDDNDYPKHLWAMIFTNKEFRKEGPSNFALAHLIDHKDHKNRYGDDFSVLPNHTQYPLHGLFTSPTNTAYIPNCLIRPSDFSSPIRQLLISRSFELYGEICQLLPPWLEQKSNSTNNWQLSDFQWADPVGDIDNIESFLSFRKNRMNNLLDA